MTTPVLSAASVVAVPPPTTRVGECVQVVWAALQLPVDDVDAHAERVLNALAQLDEALQLASAPAHVKPSTAQLEKAALLVAQSCAARVAVCAAMGACLRRAYSFAGCGLPFSVCDQLLEELAEKTRTDDARVSRLVLVSAIFEATADRVKGRLTETLDACVRVAKSFDVRCMQLARLIDVRGADMRTRAAHRAMCRWRTAAWRRCW